MKRDRTRCDATGTQRAALASYYRSPAVRARILEYCGAASVDPASMSALGIAGYGGRQRLQEPEGSPVPWRLPAWSQLLDDGADVCRSLADRVGTLLLLDVDLMNQDEPAGPYADPVRTFEGLEPVYVAARAVFARHGLHPLVLMTARGYHLVLRAVRGTPLHTSLVELGVLGEAARRRYEELPADVTAAVEMGSAHEGAGRLLEHLAYEIRRDLGGGSGLPVALLDLRPPGGGPFICLDLSAYADPVFARFTRCAFSANQDPLMRGFDVAQPVVLTLPRREEPLADLLAARADPEHAESLAGNADTRIPAAIGGAECVASYRAGPLARFHEAFDHGPEIDARSWPHTYDALDLRGLPACAALPLRRPNPALLTPAGLRSVALALWAQGWHPRSIAGLVRSRYSRPYGWGGYWQRYDPESRARFYVRLSCGAVASGAEEAAAFTCDSQRARGLCIDADCGYDLASSAAGGVRAAPPWRGAR